jgi:hypothetical protein
MFNCSMGDARPRFVPAVEQLEDRQLLSAAVRPAVISLRTVTHGHGVFAVAVIGDDEGGAQLLTAAPGTLTFTVDGGRTLVPFQVVGGVARFRRGQLRGLARGPHTLAVGTIDPSLAGANPVEDASFTLTSRAR